MKKTIAVVEDNSDIREVFRFILEDEGYFVKTYTGVNDFKSSINYSDLPKLIISDIMLLDGDGRQLCREVKSDVRTSGIPFILISALIQKSEIPADVCADDFLSKPFDIEILRQKLDYFLTEKDIAG